MLSFVVQTDKIITGEEARNVRGSQGDRRPVRKSKCTLCGPEADSTQTQRRYRKQKCRSWVRVGRAHNGTCGGCKESIKPA